MILLNERLSAMSDFNSPMIVGISPSNLLFDKSRIVKSSQDPL